jgi:hypothetical protein
VKLAPTSRRIMDHFMRKSKAWQRNDTLYAGYQVA